MPPTAQIVTYPLVVASTSSFSRPCPAGSPTPPTSGARRYSPLVGIHAIVSARSHKSPALHGEGASAPPILPPSQLSDRVRTIDIIELHGVRARESSCTFIVRIVFRAEALCHHSFILRPSSSRIASFPTELQAWKTGSRIQANSSTSLPCNA